MVTKSRVRGLVSVVLVAASVAACSGVPGGSETPTTTFYSLAPSTSGQDPVDSGGGLLVGVGPVFVPDYLNRPQIVTHATPYELTVSEFHRWGGSLEAEVGRVVTQNLAALLPGYRIVELSARMTASPDRQVIVQILNFERSAEGTVVLVAHWGILAMGGRTPLAVLQTTIAETPADEGYEALVAAMSRALAAFSRDIAGEIVRTAS